MTNTYNSAEFNNGDDGNFFLLSITTSTKLLIKKNVKIRLNIYHLGPCLSFKLKIYHGLKVCTTSSL